MRSSIRSSDASKHAVWPTGPIPAAHERAPSITTTEGAASTSKTRAVTCSRSSRARTAPSCRSRRRARERGTLGRRQRAAPSPRYFSQNFVLCVDQRHVETVLLLLHGARAPGRVRVSTESMLSLSRSIPGWAFLVSVLLAVVPPLDAALLFGWRTRDPPDAELRAFLGECSGDDQLLRVARQV